MTELRVPFLIFMLFVPHAVWADAINYDFTGTLTSSFDGSNTVTGQFTIDLPIASSAHAITAFSFTTPFGTVDSTSYTPFVVHYEGYLGLLFQAPPIQFDELVLWFQTEVPFASAPL